MSIKKTKIVLDLDADSLKELRRVLFKNGVAPQKFFTYVLDLVSTRDERVADIIQEAAKQQSGKAREADTTDAETLYQLIQDELNENKQKNGADDDAQERTEEGT